MNKRTEEEKQKILEKFNQLKNSKLKQQSLFSWQQKYTYKNTMIIFTLFGLIFLGIGLLLYYKSVDLERVYQRYDDTCQGQPVCTFQFELEETIHGPIYFYYRIDNFYQNHRRYAGSKSTDQLKGTILTVDELSDCAPVRNISELGFNKTVGNNYLTDDQPANPCGLIAKSFFNDTYKLYNGSVGENEITIDDQNLATESDKKNYKNSENYEQVQWISVEDEHFIIWMKTSGLPNFRKLWGKINGDLIAGNYTIEIQNNYDVEYFQGSKYFILSTTNLLGGNNTFLAILYLIVGSIFIIFGIIFLIAFIKKRNSNKNE